MLNEVCFVCIGKPKMRRIGPRREHVRIDDCELISALKCFFCERQPQERLCKSSQLDFAKSFASVMHALHVPAAGSWYDSCLPSIWRSYFLVSRHGFSRFCTLPRSLVQPSDAGGVHSRSCCLDFLEQSAGRYTRAHPCLCRGRPATFCSALWALRISGTFSVVSLPSCTHLALFDFLSIRLLVLVEFTHFASAAVCSRPCANHS